MRENKFSERVSNKPWASESRLDHRGVDANGLADDDWPWSWLGSGGFVPWLCRG